jgi:hypothetical protein
MSKSLGKITTNLVTKVDKWIVYLLEVEIEGKTLIKIGVTSRYKVEDRVVEILTEVWKKYRYFPKTYVARYKTVHNPYGLERMLHDYFDQRHYSTEFKFGGSTEFFDIPIEEAKIAYDEVYEMQKKELDDIPNNK